MEIGFAFKLYQEVPDPTPSKNEILLKPIIYLALRPNGNHGIVYEQGKSGLQKILNYVMVYRPVDVLRKVLSRQKIERIRNDKWLVCGFGKDEHDQYFCFAHPSAQHYQSLISVPSFWTKKISKPNSNDVLWGQLQKGHEIIFPLEKLANEMPPVSGIKNILDLDFGKVMEFLAEQHSIFKPVTVAFQKQREVKQKKHRPAQEEIGAVLFGFGNYARTIALPFLKPYVHLHKIHEIDSCLLIEAEDLFKSTNPNPDSGDEKYPVWLIAGFHHTHANLAIEALKLGVIPVIEKPIATTKEDFEAFKKTAESTGKPFFQCFQKRYQIFNDYTFEDLQVNPGDPIQYKATVFEIPLHAHHWYNWPISGSRIISNGCHWIDHFLFLNDYAQVSSFETKSLNAQELLLLISLENGANAVITLSDIGPNRIGMREYVELSVPGRRVTIVDSMKYMSESSHQIIRKESTDKLHYLRLMYQSIGKKIKSGGAGDSIRSLASTELSIYMEEDFQLQSRKAKIH